VNLPRDWVTLPPGHTPWDAFFGVYPLVLVGTLEPDGGHDVAPKHMAMPLGWQSWFGFVCTPEHRTWVNAVREGAFTVSYPRASQVLMGTLAASPRSGCGPDSKPELAAVPVYAARTVPGVLVAGCPVHLECQLDRVVGGLGGNGLLIGQVVATHVEERFLRSPDQDDGDLVFQEGLLAYLAPGRLAEIRESGAFPFPEGFTR